MAAKRKAVNGAKKCTGPCGLTLALYMYAPNGHGYLTSRCRACLRAYKRDKRKAKYHSDPEFREKYKAKRRAWYWSNEASRRRHIRRATARKQRVRLCGESRAKEIARWKERYWSDEAFRERKREMNRAYRLRMKGAA